MEPNLRDTVAAPSLLPRSVSPPPPPVLKQESLQQEPLNGEAFEALKEGDDLYSTNSPGPSNPLLPDHEQRQAPPTTMSSDGDLDPEITLLYQQLGSSYINNQYSRVPNMANGSFVANHYFSNQEQVGVRDHDVNSFQTQVNPYQTEHCSQNYPRYQTVYGLERDHHSDQINSSFNPNTSRRRRSYGIKHDGYNDISFQRIQEGFAMATTSKHGKQSHMGESMPWFLDSDIFEIMKSEHGNYPFQRFLKFCNNHELTELVLKVSEDPNKLFELATDNIGSKSFKNLIAAVKTKPMLCDYLMLVLYPKLHELMDIEHIGPNMTQYLLHHLGPRHNWLIFKAANEHLKSLSRKRTGVSSLNYCIVKLFKDELTEETKPYRNLLLSEVLLDPVELATDENGNFVVQCAIGLGIEDLTSFICQKLKDSVQLLSLSKYGTFVLEKCLNSSGAEIILEALLTCKQQVLLEITMHPYGNYVMQTAMKVLRKLPINHELVKVTRQLPPEFKNLLNTRKVVNRK